MSYEKNYYEILEVSEKASDEIIKMAYKALALKYHPDITNEENNIAVKKMQMINEAYDTLSDLEKKKQYDEFIFSAKNKKSNSNNKGIKRNIFTGVMIIIFICCIFYLNNKGDNENMQTNKSGIEGKNESEFYDEGETINHNGIFDEDKVFKNENKTIYSDDYEEYDKDYGDMRYLIASVKENTIQLYDYNGDILKEDVINIDNNTDIIILGCKHVGFLKFGGLLYDVVFKNLVTEEETRSWISSESVGSLYWYDYSTGIINDYKCENYKNEYGEKYEEFDTDYSDSIYLIGYIANKHIDLYIANYNFPISTEELNEEETIIRIMGRKGDYYDISIMDISSLNEKRMWTKTISFENLYWYDLNTQEFEAFTDENFNLKKDHDIYNTIDSNCITLYSTKEDVKRIMGPPDILSEKSWNYDFSIISFEYDYVSGWSNTSGNLIIDMPESVDENAPKCIDVGISKIEVVKIMGPPDVLSEKSWRYDFSTIYFKNNLVNGWINTSDNLKLK